MPMPPMSHPGPGPLWPIHYGPAPIPLRKEPHIPLTPKTGMRREEIERRIAEAGVTAEEKAAWNAKYAKPSTGIPKTDLASGVQASLDKAETALQEHQSLSGYATEAWVEDQGYLTEHQDITGKVDKTVLFDNPDTTPKVKSSLLPSYVDDVLEFASLSVFPTTGETGKIYVALDTNKTYRWTGTQYVQVGGDEQAQADWAQTNSSAPDFIKNKPTIPAAQVQANWNETNTSSKAYIQNKPTIPTVPTNVSAFTNDAGYLTQHQSLSAYRTATAQDAIDGAQDTAISAKYTKPADGIPATDLASGVIPSVPSASDATPQMDGTGAAGTATTYARGDHRHPIDTSRAKVLEPLNIDPGGPTMSYTTTAESNGSQYTAEIASFFAVTKKAFSSSLAPAFSTSSTYAVGDYVTHEGLLYKCTTAVSTAGSWNAANWSAVAVTDEMGGGGEANVIDTVKVNGVALTPDANKAVDIAVPAKIWAASWDSYNTTTKTAVITPFGGGFELVNDATIIVRCGTSTSPGIGGSSFKINVGGKGAKTVVASSTGTSEIYLPSDAIQRGDILIFSYRSTGNGSWFMEGVSKHSTNLTGTPTAPTAASGTNTTQVATTAFVQTAVSGKQDASARNILPYASTTTLAPETAVYQSALNNDGTFPTIVDTAIPTASAYYQFELELAVPSTVPSTITGPSGWTFLDGHGLPDPADLSGGETIYISARLDCTARTFLASVWRVA